MTTRVLKKLPSELADAYRLYADQLVPQIDLSRLTILDLCCKNLGRLEVIARLKDGRWEPEWLLECRIFEFFSLGATAKGLPPVVLSSLLNNPDWKIRALTVESQDLTEYQKTKLASDPSLKVREALKRHSLPKSAKEQLANMPDHDIIPFESSSLVKDIVSVKKPDRHDPLTWTGEWAAREMNHSQRLALANEFGPKYPTPLIRQRLKSGARNVQWAMSLHDLGYIHLAAQGLLTEEEAWPVIKTTAFWTLTQELADAQDLAEPYIEEEDESLKKPKRPGAW